MKVRIKKIHPKAVIPSYAHDSDAGMDLTAVEVSSDEYGNLVYHTGLAFEIPDGYVGLVFPRSSNSKKDLRLTNAVGVIDSGYRGEVTFKYRPTGGCDFLGAKCYVVGDRIGQIIIMPYPHIEIEAVEELSNSERGTQGYGSTGR